MPVRIDRRLTSSITLESDLFIQVVSRQLDRLRPALDVARREIATLDGGWQSAPGLSEGDTNGPKFVSAVELRPDGAAFWIDPGFSPLELLQEIPGLIKRRLEEGGVTSATITVPPEEPYLAAELVSRVAILKLFPSPDRSGRIEVPAGWIAAAAEWLRAGLGSRDHVLAGVRPVPFQVGRDSIDQWLEIWRRRRVQSNFMVTVSPALRQAAGPALRMGGHLSRGERDALAGQEWRRRLKHVRGVACVFAFDVSLELMAGGTEAGDDELFESFEELKRVARELAPATAYSFIAVQPRWRPGPNSDPSWDKQRSSMVLDAFPYQVLGSGHIRRLGRRPPGLAPLSRGKIGLQLGEPAGWGLGFRSRAREDLREAMLELHQARPRISARYGPEARPSRRRQPLPMGMLSGIISPDRAGRPIRHPKLFGFLSRYAFGLELVVDPERAKAILERNHVPFEIADQGSFGLIYEATRLLAYERQGIRARAPSTLLKAMGDRLTVRGPDLSDPASRLALHLHAPLGNRRYRRNRLPARVFTAAVDWLRRLGPADGSPMAGVDYEHNLEFPGERYSVPVNTASLFLSHCQTTDAVRSAWVSQTFESGEVARVQLETDFRGPTQLQLIWGWNDSEERQVGVYELLKEVARRCAAYICYAFVEALPDRWDRWTWVDDGGEAADLMVMLCDEFLIDVYPYQVLGPKHFRTLGRIPDGVRALADGRGELEVETLPAWLLPARRQGRRLLERCLIGEDQRRRLNL